jgi:ADP-heptose:LPS heptosyltransferase
VVGAAGAPTVHLEPELATTDADRAASLAVVPASDGPLVVVHPGATDPRRCYPEDRLGRIARTLADGGARVVVVGGASEAAKVAEVARGFGGPVETVVGGLSLPGLVGLLARADLVLANDSGPRHIAGAVGTATVGVFTAANLADVAPLLRTRHRLLVSWRGGCRVCGRGVLDGWCDHGVSATHDVREADVRAAAVELLAQVLRTQDTPSIIERPWATMLP